MKKYALLLVDDHRILLDGTKNLLSLNDQYFVKNTATTGTQALNLLKSQDYDIMITDYELPDLSGLELTKAAKAAQPEIKVVALSMYDDPSIIKEMLSNGLDGYVLKQESGIQLQTALDKVVEGRRYLSDDISDILINQVTKKEEQSLLTQREQEIVKLIAKEYSNKQIAEILFISEKTVETHRKNILRKTKAGSVVGLVKYAYANGLVE